MRSTVRLCLSIEFGVRGGRQLDLDFGQLLLLQAALAHLLDGMVNGVAQKKGTRNGAREDHRHEHRDVRRVRIK